MLLLAKQTQVRGEKTWGGINVTQKLHEKNETLPATFVGSLYKTQAILCSNIADVHGTEVHDVRIRNLFIFGKFFDFITHHDCLTKMAKFVYKNILQSVASYQSQTV